MFFPLLVSYIVYSVLNDPLKKKGFLFNQYYTSLYNYKKKEKTKSSMETY